MRPLKPDEHNQSKPEDERIIRELGTPVFIYKRLGNKKISTPRSITRPPNQSTYRPAKRFLKDFFSVVSTLKKVEANRIRKGGETNRQTRKVTIRSTYAKFKYGELAAVSWRPCAVAVELVCKRCRLTDNHQWYPSLCGFKTSSLESFLFYPSAKQFNQ